MPHTRVEPGGDWPDWQADRLMAEFGGADFAGLGFRVASLVNPLGVSPGVAEIYIGGKTGDLNLDFANSVALDKANAGKFLFGQRVKVFRITADNQKTLLWNGRVVEIAHNHTLTGNGLVLTAKDQRATANDVRVSGRWTCIPGITSGAGNQTVFRQGWHAHFNPRGMPNCLVNESGYPCFAPWPEYGLADNEAPADPAAGSTKACNWTAKMILQYLQRYYNSLYPQPGEFAYIAGMPDDLVWPDTWADKLDAVFLDETRASELRKGRDINLEGIGILDAIDIVLQGAGGFSLKVSPYDNSGDKNKLEIVRSTARNQDMDNAIDLRYADGGAVEDLDAGVASTVEIVEDANTYVAVAGGAGELVYIERRLSAPDQLRLMQTDERWDLFRRLAAGNNIVLPLSTSAPGAGLNIAGLGIASEDSFNQACTIFPEILNTYAIKGSYDFTAGTAIENKYPRALMPRPPAPEQMTMLTGAQFNLAGYGSPLYVEVETSSGVWARAPDFTGMRIMDDGKFELPFLRDVNAPLKNWKHSNPSNPWYVVDGLLQIEKLNIRMNLALPCDHRLAYQVVAQGQKAGAINSSTYDGNPHAERIDPDYSRKSYADMGDLYRNWHRKSSYPNAESDGAPVAADGVMLDQARNMRDHLRRSMLRYNRLNIRGRVVYGGRLAVTITPGTMINFLSCANRANKWPVKACVQAVRWEQGEKSCNTEIIFG